MPAKHKNMSRSSGRASSRGLEMSRSSHGTSSALSSVSQSYDRYGYKPSLETPHNYPGEEYSTTRWTSSDLSGSRRQSVMTDASRAPNYPTSGEPYWDPPISASSAMTGYPQTLDPYTLSPSSGTSLESLAYDTNLDPIAPQFASHFGDLSGLGQDFGLLNGSAGPISIASGSSIYTPPHSPETDMGMMPNAFGANADYATLDLDYSHFSGSQQDPPSPPLSEGEYPYSTGSDPFSGYRLQSGVRNSSSSYDARYPADLHQLPSGSVEHSSPCVNQAPRPAHRTLKPAPQRSREQNSETLQHSSTGHAKSKGKPAAPAPRSHKLYKATADEDGLYRCPYQQEHGCAHPPTKQKCGYDKYLDSHLRPYHCRQEGCSDLKFSSNACLFRHEREAHGLHAYGKNPHLCQYSGCERSIDGFPRRWNLNDHMRRVHKHDSSPQAMEFPGDIHDYELPNKRKGSGAPACQQMKRTSSAQAKARAASSTYCRDQLSQMDVNYVQQSHSGHNGTRYADQYAEWSSWN